MPPEEEDLDPATLRALAAEMDAQESAYLDACPCPIHRNAANHCRTWATDYRTRAIKVELAQAGRSDA